MMKKTRRTRALATILALFSLPAIAALPAIKPGSIALAFIEASSKADQNPGRRGLILAAMTQDFSRLGAFSALPQDEVDKAVRGLRLLRSMDTRSLPDAVLLGQRLGAQAQAVAALTVVDRNAVLTIRLYDVEAQRKIGEASVNAAPDRIAELLESGITELCSEWSARNQAAPETLATEAPAPEAPAAPVAPGSSATVNLSFLAGYGTVASMNWELEASVPESPLSLGLEFAYERVDLWAMPGDVLSVSAIGRWWPLNGEGRDGLFLSLGAGVSADMLYGAQAGPFRAAVGWTFRLWRLGSQLGFGSPLRIQPEIGFAWSTRPRWWSRVIGVLPYAGIKVGI
jgi:hypothetical protein